MITYPKINSIYMRDENGKFTAEYAQPEFEYLAGNLWEATEKIDGTNIRVGWNGEKVEFGARTENAQIPTFLLSYLQEVLTPERLGPVLSSGEYVLFGEGYGRKIQKVGARYIPDGVSFILYDVWCGGWWLRRWDIYAIAAQLGIDRVPVVGKMTLDEACHECREGFASRVGDLDAEGLVLRPEVDLFSRDGSRIITKVKLRDFRR